MCALAFIGSPLRSLTARIVFDILQARCTLTSGWIEWIGAFMGTSLPEQEKWIDKQDVYLITRISMETVALVVSKMENVWIEWRKNVHSERTLENCIIANNSLKFWSINRWKIQHKTHKYQLNSFHSMRIGLCACAVCTTQPTGSNLFLIVRTGIHSLDFSHVGENLKFFIRLWWIY